MVAYMRIMFVACMLLAVACRFDTSGQPIDDPNAPDGAVTDGPMTSDGMAIPDATPGPDACADPVQCQGWWDVSYQYRQPLAVSVGGSPPMKGYAGYTVRLTGFDTTGLISELRMLADCGDLRIVRQPDLGDPGTWTELSRNVLGCNTDATEVHFMAAADIADNGTDDAYYMYYGHGAAATPAVGTTDVYLWYDDASTDRLASYEHGRIEWWSSGVETVSGWIDSAAYNGNGYYTYSTGNNNIEGYRRAVDERDVYVEAEFMHTGCSNINMRSGLIVRGVIDSGDGGFESADHFYASQRSENSSCGGGYTYDGNIVTTSYVGDVAVSGANPPSITEDAWRKQALAAWGVGPVNLTFWDADTPWTSLGFAPATDVHVSGTDDTYNRDSPGFAGIWLSQDAGRFRNLVIRRYTEPEPTVTAGAVEPRI